SGMPACNQHSRRKYEVLKKRMPRALAALRGSAGDPQGICGFYNIFQSINPPFSNVNFPVLRLITSIPLAASVVEISFLPK
ncbi:hypothetical protein, partial [Klebsiella pneumoniae]